MKFLENFSLKKLNTFGFQVKSRYFADVHSMEQLLEALTFSRNRSIPLIPLGGGSNLILSRDLDALVIQIGFKGKDVLSRSSDQVVVRAGAGESWHPFMRWSLEKQAYGLENLSLIPGNVGAAPIQNIGAYGVELKDFFQSLEALDIATGQVKVFTLHECQFGYRDSVFKKKEALDRFIITSVTFKLDKNLSPKLDYGKLRDEVQQQSVVPDAFTISEAVCNIRQKKLPDPSVLGNAGSFFKNPIISSVNFKKLQANFPDLVGLPFQGQRKLAAGWLIDHAGLQGFPQDFVGTHKHHALILVNYGGAKPEDLMKLAKHIQYAVFEKFGIHLEIEPRIY